MEVEESNGVSTLPTFKVQILDIEMAKYASSYPGDDVNTQFLNIIRLHCLLTNSAPNWYDFNTKTSDSGKIPCYGTIVTRGVTKKESTDAALWVFFKDILKIDPSFVQEKKSKETKKAVTKKGGTTTTSEETAVLVPRRKLAHELMGPRTVHFVYWSSYNSDMIKKMRTLFYANVPQLSQKDFVIVGPRSVDDMCICEHEVIREDDQNIMRVYQQEIHKHIVMCLNKEDSVTGAVQTHPPLPSPHPWEVKPPTNRKEIPLLEWQRLHEYFSKVKYAGPNNPLIPLTPSEQRKLNEREQVWYRGMEQGKLSDEIIKNWSDRLRALLKERREFAKMTGTKLGPFFMLEQWMLPELIKFCVAGEPPRSVKAINPSEQFRQAQKWALEMRQRMQILTDTDKKSAKQQVVLKIDLRGMETSMKEFAPNLRRTPDGTIGFETGWENIEKFLSDMAKVTNFPNESIIASRELIVNKALVEKLLSIPIPQPPAKTPTFSESEMSVSRG